MGELPGDGFSAFCEAQHRRLVGSLGLFCGDVDLAEEFAQEALIRACRDWKKVSRMAAPGAWVHKVAMNLARSHFRRKKVERRINQKLRSAKTDVSDASEAVAIRSAVAQLPVRQKTALLLRFYVDLPISEVAQQMNCSPGAVKALLRRALDALRGQEGLTLIGEVRDVV